MSRPKKNGKFLNCYVDKEIMDRLSEFSVKSFIPKTAIVEEALRQYFSKNDPQTDADASAAKHS